MAEHICNYEERWGKVLNQLETLCGKVYRHVDDGDKPGGFRDRILLLEETVSTLKKSYWKTALVCGVIGGLLGKLSPDIFNLFTKAVFAQ